MKLGKNKKIMFGNREIKVIDLLGDGGQGEVYLIEDAGSKYALKIYKDKPSKDFKANLRNNILRGAPNESFLWPKECCEIKGVGFGYIMDLRPNNYESFMSYLNGKTKFDSARIMLDWSINLVDSFKKLHEKGYSYQDINDGSFFIEPKTGDVLICDNDNVTVDKTNLGVLGMKKFMAPEIVRGDINKLTKERQMPDIHSDRFSLAVILFYTLCKGDPFEGERLKNYNIIDEKAEQELYGNPIYVYNNNNTSNRPIRGYHDLLIKRYKLLPSYIKEAFHKTFVDGIKDRENGRLTEIEWLNLLCRYRDELISCRCGRYYHYGFFDKNINSSCPFCKSNTRKLTYLVLNKRKVVLEPGKSLFKFHLDKGSDQYNVPIAQVIQSKSDPTIWGIRLSLDTDVLVKDTSNNEKTIDKNGVIPIINGLKVKFNDDAIGQINVL